MGHDNYTMSKPGNARYAIAPRAGGINVVIAPNGTVYGRYASREHAETARDQAQARADAAAKRTTRPCMSCQKPFESEGIHNRLCGGCRSRPADGWNPHGIAPRSGRPR